MFAVASLLGMMSRPPLPQSQGYMRFADTRSWLGLPNALDVLTNLGFLLVGGLGLAACLQRYRLRAEPEGSPLPPRPGEGGPVVPMAGGTFEPGPGTVVSPGSVLGEQAGHAFVADGANGPDGPDGPDGPGGTKASPPGFPDGQSPSPRMAGTGSGADGAFWSWCALFVGTALVAFGSGYFHWRPENWTLMWDRLPMSISFMGLFSILLCEQVFPNLSERVVLLPLLAIGIGSVVYWYVADDLRLYLWVQFFPLLCIMVIPFLFPARFTHSWCLVLALGLYVLAKFTEARDLDVFQGTGNLLSGHSVKHLLAAAASWVLYRQFRHRTPLREGPGK